ncbi:MAG: ABC transporter permease [Clostridiaceae bacterium]
MNKLKKSFTWETSLVIMLVLEILIFGMINPRFLDFHVLIFSINDFIAISIVSLFVTFVIITGGIDISDGSIIGLVSIVIGVTWKMGGVNIWLTIPIALLVGALCGALNGFLVAYANVQAMVVTLGGMILYSGLSLVVMGLSGASAFEGISGMPESFVNLANGSVLNIPNPVIILIVLIILAYILLNKTKYGRAVFLVGINKNTARYSGINTKLVTMSTYILSGTGAAIAGIILTSYLGSSRPDLGADTTMPIITAVVLGGTAITGGKGSVLGTALAAIIVGLLKFGLQMVGVSTQYVSVAIGLLLIVAIAMRSIDFKNLPKLKKSIKAK